MTYFQQERLPKANARLTEASFHAIEYVYFGFYFLKLSS